MLLEIPEDQQVIFEFSRSPSPCSRVRGECFVIILALEPQRASQLATLRMMVNRFNGLLNPDSDAQADDNGCDLCEEVSPGAYRRVDMVHVEQLGLLLRR